MSRRVSNPSPSLLSRTNQRIFKARADLICAIYTEAYETLDNDRSIFAPQQMMDILQLQLERYAHPMLTQLGIPGICTEHAQTTSAGTRFDADITCDGRIEREDDRTSLNFRCYISADVGREADVELPTLLITLEYKFDAGQGQWEAADQIWFAVDDAQGGSETDSENDEEDEQGRYRQQDDNRDQVYDTCQAYHTDSRGATSYPSHLEGHYRNHQHYTHQSLPEYSAPEIARGRATAQAVSYGIITRGRRLPPCESTSIHDMRRVAIRGSFEGRSRRRGDQSSRSNHDERSSRDI